MKLIRENIDDIRFLIEADSSDPVKKRMYIEGVFLQSGIKNRNGRLYPSEIMEREVARYMKELVESGRALGELGHPNGPTINQERVAIRITKLTKEGNNYIGKALVTNTPYGNILENLINDGYKPGCSSRGLGSLKEANGLMEVQDDFRLATAADVVQDPSAPDAFVRGIMEGVEWWYDVASGTWQKEQLHETHKQMKKMSVREISEQKVALFENFLSTLVKQR